MLRVPVCWTLLGTPRDSWIVSPGHDEDVVVRDKFGFEITDDTWVITNDTGNVFSQGERTMQQVDYPHGLHMGHNSALHMVEDSGACRLCDVVSVRAVQHFVHLWKRNARVKLLRRKAKELRHVLMVVWGRKLLGQRIPQSIGRDIYALTC